MSEYPAKYHKAKCELLSYPRNIVHRKPSGEENWQQRIMDDFRDFQDEDTVLDDAAKKILDEVLLNLGQGNEVRKSFLQLLDMASDRDEADAIMEKAESRNLHPAKHCFDALFRIRWGGFEQWDWDERNLIYESASLNQLVRAFGQIKKLRSDDFAKELDTRLHDARVNEVMNNLFRPFLRRTGDKLLLFEIGAAMEKRGVYIDAVRFYEWAQKNTDDPSFLRDLAIRWIVCKEKQAANTRTDMADEIREDVLKRKAELNLPDNVPLPLVPKFEQWESIFDEVLQQNSTLKKAVPRTKKPQRSAPAEPAASAKTQPAATGKAKDEPKSREEREKDVPAEPPKKDAPPPAAGRTEDKPSAEPAEKANTEVPVPPMPPVNPPAAHRPGTAGAAAKAPVPPPMPPVNPPAAHRPGTAGVAAKAPVPPPMPPVNPSAPVAPDRFVGRVQAIIDQDNKQPIKSKKGNRVISFVNLEKSKKTMDQPPVQPEQEVMTAPKELVSSEPAPVVADETMPAEPAPVVADETVAPEPAPAVADETAPAEPAPVVAKETVAPDTQEAQKEPEKEEEKAAADQPVSHEVRQAAPPHGKPQLISSAERFEIRLYGYEIRYLWKQNRSELTISYLSGDDDLSAKFRNGVLLGAFDFSLSDDGYLLHSESGRKTPFKIEIGKDTLRFEDTRTNVSFLFPM